MKKTVLLTITILFSVIFIQAQNNQQSGGGFTAPYVPFHQYLEQHQQDFQRVEHGERHLVYLEISQRGDKWQTATNNWLYLDSANYSYTSQGWETEYNTYNYKYAMWSNNTRWKFTYDGNGNRLTFIVQYWDSAAGTYVNSSQSLFTYNSNNSVTSSTYQFWVSHLNNWRNTSLETYTYDGNNNVTSNIIQHWDTATSAWANYIRTDYDYDNYNNQIRYVGMNFNSGIKWDTVDQFLKTYDGNHNMINEITQSYDSGVWYNGYQYAYAYNGANAKTEAVTNLWNPYTSAFDSVQKNIYTLDGNNNVLQQTATRWNNSTNIWNTYFRVTSTYNSANKLTWQLNENSDSTGLGWANHTELFETYDVNNNQLSYLQLDWLAASGIWDTSFRYNNTFDINNNVIYELYQSYKDSLHAFVNANQYFFYYGSYNTGIQEAENNLSAIVYPNPSDGKTIFLSLNLEENANLIIQLYDAAGRIISIETRLADKGHSLIQLDNTGLSAGNYFVRLYDRTSGKTGVLKFVVQR